MRCWARCAAGWKTVVGPEDKNLPGVGVPLWESSLATCGAGDACVSPRGTNHRMCANPRGQTHGGGAEGQHTRSGLRASCRRPNQLLIAALCLQLVPQG